MAITEGKTMATIKRQADSTGKPPPPPAPNGGASIAARYEAIGWCHAFCCAAMDDGRDPRQIDCAEILEKAKAQLGA